MLRKLELKADINRNLILDPPFPAIGTGHLFCNLLPIKFIVLLQNDHWHFHDMMLCLRQNLTVPHRHEQVAENASTAHLKSRDMILLRPTYCMFQSRTISLTWYKNPLSGFCGPCRLWTGQKSKLNEIISISHKLWKTVTVFFVIHSEGWIFVWIFRALFRSQILCVLQLLISLSCVKVTLIIFRRKNYQRDSV